MPLKQENNCCMILLAVQFNMHKDTLLRFFEELFIHSALFILVLSLCNNLAKYLHHIALSHVSYWQCGVKYIYFNDVTHIEFQIMQISMYSWLDLEYQLSYMSYVSVSANSNLDFVEKIMYSQIIAIFDTNSEENCKPLLFLGHFSHFLLRKLILRKSNSHFTRNIVWYEFKATLSLVSKLLSLHYFVIMKLDLS